MSTLLRLPATGQEQDWELELADGRRCAEFVAFYERLDSDDDRKALMALVLASYDECLQMREADEALWARIAAILVAERTLHDPLVRYWAVDDAEGDEEVFSLTPLVRRVRANH